MALVLTRKQGESTLLTKEGEVVGRITIIEIGDKKVKLSFEAPKDVVIMREEILSRSPTEK